MPHPHHSNPHPKTPAQVAASNIFSTQGQRTTLYVGLLRAGTILSTALVFASAGYLLAETFSPEKGLNNLLIWLLIGLGAAGAVTCAYTEITYGTHQARLEEKKLRERLLRRFFTAAFTPKQTPAPRHIALMTDSVERVTEYRQIYWGATLASITTPAIILLYITALDWVTGTLILLILPLVPASIWLFFRYFRKISSNSRAQRAALSVSYLDAIRNLTTIRLLGAGQRTENKLRAQGEKNRQAVMKLLASNQLVIIIMDAVFLLFLITWSITLISWRANTGNLTTAQALSALLLLPLLLEPLTQVAGFFYIGMGGRASHRALQRTLSTPTTPKHPTPTPQTTPTTTPNPIISAHNISHNYGRGPLFTNLTFTIAPGEKIAIQGPSGTGKTTLLSLLRGTLPLQTGTLTINGQNVNQLTPEQAAQTSASVTQNTWLFTGTIADNLRYANPQATDTQLWQALHQANLAEEIRDLPHQLNTNIGEAGSRLSGGQAQRLSLARAVLAQRPIILLDEPTSHIDPESEQKIIHALENLDPNITLIMVTHRTSLLTLANRVFNLTPNGLTTTTPAGTHEP